MSARIIPFPIDERRRRIRLERLQSQSPALLIDPSGVQPGFGFRLRPGDFPVSVSTDGCQLTITSYCGQPVPPPA